MSPPAGRGGRNPDIAGAAGGAEILCTDDGMMDVNSQNYSFYSTDVYESMYFIVSAIKCKQQ